MKYQKWILFLIFLLAFVLRVYQSGVYPLGFLADEAALGYNAYSILETGRDEWGELLPLTSLKSFGDYKNPLYVYLTIPSIWLFGLNEFSTRLPAAFFGALTIFILYLFIKELLPSSALVSAFLLAVSPWHIVNSRMAHSGEGIVALFFLILGAFLFLKSLKRKKLLIPSIACFLLSIFSYHTSRVFIPFFGFSLFLIYKKEFFSKRKNYWQAFFICLLLFLPLLFSLFSWEGKSRLVQTTKITNIGLLNDINEKRGFCQKSLPFIFCRSFYNRATAYITYYFTNYFNHFSVKTLFSGSVGIGTFMLAKRGFFYLWELPFFILGLVFIFRKKINFSVKIIFSWLLIYPLADSFTGFDNPLRMLIGLPAFIIVTAYGITIFFQNRKWKIFKIPIFFLIVFSLSSFAMDYFHYQEKFSDTHHFGYRDLFKALREKEAQYEKIYITKQYDNIVYIFYLFYSQYDPKHYQENKNIERLDIFDFQAGIWASVNRIGKFYFFDSLNFAEFSDNSLVILTPKQIPKADNLSPKPELKINDKNNQPVFLVFDSNKLKKFVKDYGSE